MEKAVIVLAVFHDYFLNSNLQWFNEFNLPIVTFPSLNAFSAKLKMKIQLFLGPFWLLLSHTKSFLYRRATCKFCGVILQVSLYCTNESLLTCYSHWKTSTQVLPQTAQLLLLSFSDRPEIQNKKNKPDKGLFTWSGGLRSSGVGFFCFVSPRAWKQKKPTPLDRGPPLHVNRV